MPDPTEVRSSVHHAVARLRGQLKVIRNELADTGVRGESDPFAG